MRTYEDVKIALKKYQDELANEAGSKQPHWIVIGGNMCIVKKGASTQYILGKGDPVPMIKATAESNLAKFQSRCGDNIELRMVEYTAWLNEEIKECEHLIACMQKSLAGEDPEQIPTQTRQAEAMMENAPVCGPDANARIINVSCPTCPYGVNTCMTCKYAVGIRMQVVPWEIICGAPIKTEEVKEE